MADSLNVVITGQDQGLSPMLGDINAKIAQLEAQLGSMNKRTVETNTAMEAMSGHAGTVARGLNALGLEAEGSAARVEGLFGAMEELSKAAPQLLLVAGGFTAIFEATKFLKDGVAAASEFQGSMETLRAAVEAQGGSWASASAAIQQFVQTESIASGFTQNELLSAMNALVTAGTNVHDSMILVSVAEETAIAHHMKVEEVTQLLIAAEAGRGQGLARLDPQIRQMIKNHADLNSVLEVLHKLNLRQIDDGDGLERAEMRKNAAVQAASESIGKLMLPMLTQWDTDIVGLIHALNDFGTAIGEWDKGLVAVIQSAGKAFYDFAVMANDAMHLDLPGAAKAWGALGGDVAAGWKGATEAVKGFTDGFKALTQDIPSLGAADISKDDALHRARDLHLANDPTLGLGGKGKKKGGSSAAPFDGTSFGGLGIDEQGLSKSSTDLAGAEASVNAAMSSLNTTINQNATSTEDASVKQQKLYKAYQDAITALPNLIGGVREEETTVKASQAAVDAKYAAYQRAKQAVDEIKASLDGKNKLEVAEKEKLKHAEDAQKSAEQAYKSADATLKQNTATLQAHQRELENTTKKIAEFKAAQQQIVETYNDQVAAAREALSADEATHGLGLAQEIAYYANRYNIAHQKNLEFLAENGYRNEKLVHDDAALYAKLLGVEGQYYNQQFDEAKKHYDEEVKLTAGFLDDLIVKHKSFKDVFKTIWDDIVKIFIDAVAKMIAESALFKSIFGNMMPSGGGANFSGTNFLSLAMGAAGGGPGTIATPSGTAQLVHIAGVDPSLSGGGGGMFGGGGGFLGGSFGAGLGVAGLAIGGGSMIGGMLGANTGAKSTHEENGMIGSLAGAGLVAALGPYTLAGLLTPIGLPLLLAGIIGGGLIGGMMGPHWGPPSNYPDRSNTVPYGTFVSDWNGVAGAFNGQTINPEQQYAGKSNDMAAQMAAWANAHPNDPLAKQILALGSSGTDLGIANEHDGIFTLSDGKQVSVSDLMSIGQQFQSMQGKTGTNAAPVFTITRTYPDFNIAGGAGGSSTGGPGSGEVRKPPTDGPGSDGNGKVVVDLRGAQIVGPGGLDEVAQMITTALKRNSNGELAGGYATSITNTRQNWPL